MFTAFNPVYLYYDFKVVLLVEAASLSLKHGAERCDNALWLVKCEIFAPFCGKVAKRAVVWWKRFFQQ